MADGVSPSYIGSYGVEPKDLCVGWESILLS